MIFSPVQSKLRRWHRPHIAAAQVARRSWILAPAEETVSPAAIFIEGELARISGFSAHSSGAQELARLPERRCFRRATVASEFDDVVLCGGNLYAGAYKHRMRDGRRLLARISSEVKEGGVPCSSWLGGKYFGHWLAEDTALKLLAPSIGPPTELEAPQTAHQAAYNALFGIERRVLPDQALVRRLTLVDTDLCSSFRDRGWARMTARIAARFPSRPHLGCMLLRGSSGAKRRLVNEAEVAEHLSSLGFRIVDPATAALDDILAAASGSRIVVGVEGSQLAHGFHCLDGHGALLVLQPPDRFGCMSKDRCDRKGARFAFSVGHPVPSGFRIEMDSLMRVLDRVIAQLRLSSPAGLA